MLECGRSLAVLQQALRSSVMSKGHLDFPAVGEQREPSRYFSAASKGDRR